MTDAFPDDGSSHSDCNPVALSGDRGSLSEFGRLGHELSQALSQLEQQSLLLKLAPLAGRDWYDLLIRKLLPQLDDNSHLIVAVVGGTNIGKSVVFNHIAGFRASSSSPLASGTKHPVCLIPDGFESRHDLQSLFPAFELRPWVDSDEALANYSEHCLFWRTNRDVPSNLVILDTPDVDSDAPVNWFRADAVRQAADVLVAVLTQQKYNDAAVKQFFRKAAEEDKAALIVFNQVELPDDEPYWPLWLKTFCGETGLQPEFVYLAPNDRKAAESIRLSFVERQWPADDKQIVTNDTNAVASPSDPAPTSGQPVEHLTSTKPVNLSRILSQLRFGEIKLRTLRGSLKRLVSEADGVPAYLRDVRSRSQQYQDAAEVFASRSLIRHADWPAPPNSLIVDDMWKWWDKHREVWTSNIHGFYAHISRLMTGGVRIVRERIWGQPTAPLDDYRREEWDAIVRVLQQVYGQLQVITTLGNELLTSRLDQLLSGKTCESVIQQLRKEHDEFDFQKLVESLVEAEMSSMRNDREKLFSVMRNADRAAAVARPVLTLLLAFGGVFGAEQMLVHAASQSLTHVAVDATVAAGTTVAGNAAVETATGVLGQVKAWLLQLHVKFKEKREEWLTDQLRKHLLGDLLDELQAGAAVPNGSAFAAVDDLVRQFHQRLVTMTGSETIDAAERPAENR